MAFGGILSRRERKLNLNPLRDLVENIAKVQAHEAFGMRLLLLGNDVLALQQRLQSPQDYIRKYGHRRKLQIYLIWLCPMITKTTENRDKLLNFPLFGIVWKLRPKYVRDVSGSVSTAKKASRILASCSCCSRFYY